MLGFSYLNLNKYYFAQTAFEKAYDLDTQWPITQYFLGLTHMELGNLKDAALFLDYANQNGFEPQILVKRKLADLYLENKDYAKAVALYEEILNINNQDIGSFVRPIWLYLDFLNEPAKALGLAEKAVAAFPNDAMSYNLLGWSQTGAKKLDEAEKNLKKATELNPDFAAAFYNLGKLYMTQERKTEALDAFKKAYELDQTGSIGSLAAQRYNELSNP
jgi:tetratricopeptide (TPR) repeat protein